MKYFDITPTITEDLAVWPGDVGFRRDVSLSLDKGDNLTLSSLNTTVHLGAHADAPNHYLKGGAGIGERSLHYYLGECQVIHLDLAPGARIYPDQVGEIKGKRVLFGTGSYPNPYQWNDDFNALSPELVHHLAAEGVILVGIDTPSIDPFASKELESHAAVAEKDMAVLEGIVLKDVPSGMYDLVALPLKIKDADASPVRAVLIGV